MFKKVITHAKRSVKLLIILFISVFLIIGAVAFLYKPTYSVFINNDNIAFVQVNDLPEYKLCLLKKDIVTNDEEIYSKIKEQGITYYRYYAVLENEEEKLYVSNFEEAEKVVNGLKEKNSTNINNISILEKYETDMKEIITSEEAISKLYVEPAKVVTVAKKSTSYNKYTATGSVNTATTTSTGVASLGISLIRPVSGIITSRFGARSSIRSSAHTGLDIATSSGTPIAAAASGTVTFSGYKGSYGNLLVISHENGVQTYYGHCSSLYVSAGASVSQGQTIAAVGSTGNSTGPHLHLEIRVNGVAYNPQNYLY